MSVLTCVDAESKVRSGNFAGVTKAERHKAIAQAYRRFAPRIARQIAALTGDPAAIEDLLNETFARAYEQLPEFEGRSSLSTWLHGIALNVARAHETKRRRRRRLDAKMRVDEASAPDLEAQLRTQQAVERLYAAIDQLGEDLRLPFVLCVLEGKTLQEASELLGVPVSTLHARKRRAEAFVRQQVDGEEAKAGP